MANRKFRLEYIRGILERDEIDRINNNYDHSMAAEFCDVVFKSKDDGKFYAFEYHFNSDVGVDSFDGRDDDHVVDCYEVEKVTVTTTSWQRV